jgi:hypothetical protein
VCKRFYKLQDMEGTIYKPEYVLKGVWIQELLCQKKRVLI